MKNNRFLFAVLGLLCFAASSVYAQDPTITVGNTSGDPGDPVSVETTWDTGGGSYLGVGYEVAFDDTVLAFTGCALQPPYNTYMLAVCQLKAGTTDIVSIGLINNIITPGPIPTGTLAMLSFTIDGGATPGTSTPLTLDPRVVDLGEGLGQTPTTLVDGFVDINLPPQPAYDSNPVPGTPFIFGGVQGGGVVEQPLEIFNVGEPGSVLYVHCGISSDPDGVFLIGNPNPFQLLDGELFVMPVGCNLNNPVGPHGGELRCIYDSTPQFGEGSQEALYPLSCEISEQPAFLTVVKIVENGTTGGTLTPGDFALFIDGDPVVSGDPNEVAPGVPHIVSEAPEDGYVGVIGGDCDVEGFVVLEPGQSAECTITNTAQQATLTVTKRVINGDTGATLDVGDFTLLIDDTTVTSGDANDVVPGTYTVGEVPVPGYTMEISGDCDPGTGEVTLALGETKSCIIENTAQQATLTVTKVVDNGGTPGPLDVADFALFIGADPVTSGVANDVAPGTYTVSETAEDGYTGVISGDCNLAGEVTVGVGEDAACTITNTRDAFTLTVTKVMNPPGFTDLFIMDANGVEGTPAGNGATSAAQVLYGDDAYIDELAGVGTDLNFWNSTYECVDAAGALLGQGDGSMFEFTMPAADVDCTITNVRKMEQITFAKETVQLPDGEFCFSMIDVFGILKEGPCIETSGGYGSINALGMVGHYQFNEIIDGQYALISASCDNGQNPEDGFDLVPGEPLTCTWVNGPALAIPVNNPWALLLLVLMVLGVGWYYRPAIMRRH